MNAQQVITMRRLWAANLTMKAMATEMHVKLRRVQRYIELNHHLFPARKGTKPRTAYVKQAVAEVRVLPSDRMRWITEQGASVTLPRVSFISCPRSA
jgi:hypothetical protein